MKTFIKMVLKNYGKMFYKLRTECNLTQLEVAKTVHCSQAIISHIEQGFFLPSETLEKAILKLYRDKQKGVVK